MVRMGLVARSAGPVATTSGRSFGWLLYWHRQCYILPKPSPWAFASRSHLVGRTVWDRHPLWQSWRTN